MQKLLVFALTGVAATLVLGGSFASGATSSDDAAGQIIAGGGPGEADIYEVDL
jgi:hypothetical protein